MADIFKSALLLSFHNHPVDIRTRIANAIKNVAGKLMDFFMPMSIGQIYMTISILTIANNGNMTITGQLPYEDYANATFKCELEPFQPYMKFIGISEGGNLSINGERIGDGSCHLRFLVLPAMFIEGNYDGVLTLKTNVQARFRFTNSENATHFKTEFDELLNSADNNLLPKFDDFLVYERNLGHTYDYSYDDGNASDFLQLNFTIEHVGNFHFKMTPQKLFNDTSHPLLGIYAFENETISANFYRKREIEPFNNIKPKLSGTIEFKQPLRGLSGVLFGAHEKEMRFYGKPSSIGVDLIDPGNVADVPDDEIKGETERNRDQVNGGIEFPHFNLPIFFIEIIWLLLLVK